MSSGPACLLTPVSHGFHTLQLIASQPPDRPRAPHLCLPFCSLLALSALSPRPTSPPGQSSFSSGKARFSCELLCKDFPGHLLPVFKSVVINQSPFTTFGTASPVPVQWVEGRKYVGSAVRLQGGISAWPLTSCVTLGKVGHPSEFRCSYLLNGDKALIQPTFLTAACKALPDLSPSSIPVVPTLQSRPPPCSSLNTLRPFSLLGSLHSLLST